MQASVPLGVVLANLAFLVTNAVMSPAAFMAYGWRIPFLGWMILVGLGIFIRFVLRTRWPSVSCGRPSARSRKDARAGF